MRSELEPSAGAEREAAFSDAIDIVTRWSRTVPEFTGIWLDRRRRFIGVGISDGDDLAATDRLQAVLPPGITVQVRIASADWARLRQLQVHVFDFLLDDDIWGRDAVSVGIEGDGDHLVVGLLPTTSDETAARTRARFPTHDLVIRRDASHAVAL